MEFTGDMITSGSEAKDDLVVRLELIGKGRCIEINSKVARKFYQSIKEDVEEILNEYKIQNVKIKIDDMGAFDFAIKARVETAVKRALAKQEEVK
ncbi:MAG: citrate lyase subunit gamma [Succiniclasticum sp.]|nr:citrate lyase subunit gamma [Succiniclasticum sp.]